MELSVAPSLRRRVEINRNFPMKLVELCISPTKRRVIWAWEVHDVLG